MTAANTFRNSATGPILAAPLRMGALLLAALSLSGCVGYASIRAGQSPVVRAVTPLPIPSATPKPATPAVVPPAATAAAPAAPAAPSGPLDARSGMHQAAVVSISGNAERHFTVLFRPALTEPARIEAAPAQICQSAGRSLAGSKTNTPGSSSAMPGVQTMIVHCAAA